MTDPHHTSTQSSSMRIWAIIPAAGQGRRLGGPKQTLPYANSTLAGTIARTMLSANVEGVVVVTRTELVDMLDLPIDPHLHIEFNNDAHSEMIDSVRIGLQRIESLRTSHPIQSDSHDGVLIIPSDIPGISVQTCTQCIETFKKDPTQIVIATHKKKSGHPIIFPLAMQAEIKQLNGGLNMLAKRYPNRVFYVAVDEPGILADIDTMNDYKRLTDNQS